MGQVKREKINYIPGIISLFILPFLFIHYANKEIKRKSLFVMPVLFADKSLPEKYPGIYKLPFPPKRNYMSINFTGDKMDDRIKLAFSQIRIREILSMNDSTSGLQFHFGDNSQYETFVKAIDILRIENAQFYVPLEKDIWFYHIPPDRTTFSYFLCGTTYTIVDQEMTRVSLWENAEIIFFKIWKTSWQIMLAFIAFILSNLIIRKMKKKEKIN